MTLPLLNNLLDIFIEKELLHYGVALVNVQILESSPLQLVGTVLTSKQKSRLLKLVNDTGIRVVDHIKITSAIEDRTDLGWARTAALLTDVYNQPRALFDSSELQDKARNTQLFHDEIVRILARHEGFSLIQKMDYTLGWVLDEILLPQSQSYYLEWEQIIRARVNGLYPGSVERLLVEAHTYLETPYLLGGISRTGIDCSGLMQQVYWEVMHLLLPKFSQDQLSCGKFVPFEEVQPGDMVFVDRIKDGFHHVGMAINDQQMIHASSRMKKVIVWDFELLWKFYRLVGVRRLVDT
ncbi:MAG: C40 family peptidase [bacterium]